MKVFPTCIFSPEGIDADIDRRTVSGGTAISGEEDLVVTDGGGRVFVEFANLYLDEPPIALAYRALSAYSDGGAAPFIVALCDTRHQPTNGITTVSHSDGSPFSDETLYAQGDAEATIAEAASLRATTLKLNIALVRGLLGGEWLSIDHATYRHRCYRIAEVVEQTSTTATIKIRPPLREATPAGAEVTLDHPRCVMRVDGEMRSPATLGYPEASVRFVEHFPGPEGYANG